MQVINKLLEERRIMQPSRIQINRKIKMDIQLHFGCFSL